jgi:type IV pilus assembly protein PilW
MLDRILSLQSNERMSFGNQKGFTLAELLVAMSLSLIVLGAVYSVYRVQAHTVKVQEHRMEAQEYARVALDMMVREIRNSGYFPNQTPCGGNPTNGIAAFSINSIHFVYDYTADGDCADPGEDITYTHDPVSLNISRTDGNGPTTMTDGNITFFEFKYFDVNGAETTVAANIKRVSVLLTVRSKSTDTQFNGQQTITMNSTIDLRNRF